MRSVFASLDGLGDSPGSASIPTVGVGYDGVHESPFYCDTCPYYFDPNPVISPGEQQILLVRDTAVPEPGIITLFGAGLAGLGFAIRRRLYV